MRQTENLLRRSQSSFSSLLSRFCRREHTARRRREPKPAKLSLRTSLRSKNAGTYLRSSVRAYMYHVRGECLLCGGRGCGAARSHASAVDAGSIVLPFLLVVVVERFRLAAFFILARRLYVAGFVVAATGGCLLVCFAFHDA